MCNQRRLVIDKRSEWARRGDLMSPRDGCTAISAAILLLH